MFRPPPEIAPAVEGNAKSIFRPSSFLCSVEYPGTQNHANSQGTGVLTVWLPASDESGALPQFGSLTPSVATAPSTEVQAAPEAPTTAAEPAQRNKPETNVPERRADREQISPVAAPPSLEEAWIRAGPALAGAVLTPLVLLAGIGLLLFRLRGLANAVIRIENVGGAPGHSIALADLAGLLQANLLKPAPAQEIPERATPSVAVEETTGQPFELGPTFEQELLLSQEQGLRQEAGVLQKLFEDNLQLQKQLTEPEPVPA